MLLFHSIFFLLGVNAIFAIAKFSSENSTGSNVVELVGKPIFDYHKNGLKVDIRVLSEVNDKDMENQSEDDFPDFPAREIGRCVLDLSLSCVQKQIFHYVEDIDRLDRINLIGNSVRIVRSKIAPKSEESERSIVGDVGEMIDKSIDNFFDTHALRVNLPKWNGKLSQVNVMLEESSVEEGRGKKGKGGKGGKCKKMMMMMVGGLKMKLMGMMAMAGMKSMIMSGMSLMMSKMMLIMKLISLKKGGGGGGGCSSGGCGGGGGGGGYPAPKDSYGAPPPSSYGAPPSSSYGAPSGGGDWSGGGGGGGGWGRSFDNDPRYYTNYNNYNNYNNQDYADSDSYLEYKPIKPNSNQDGNWFLWNSTSEWSDQENRQPMYYSEDKKSKEEKEQKKNENSLKKVDYKNWSDENFARIRNLLGKGEQRINKTLSKS